MSSYRLSSSRFARTARILTFRGPLDVALCLGQDGFGGAGARRDQLLVGIKTVLQLGTSRKARLFRNREFGAYVVFHHFLNHVLILLLMLTSSDHQLVEYGVPLDQYVGLMIVDCVVCFISMGIVDFGGTGGNDNVLVRRGTGCGLFLDCAGSWEGI
jgi:hypothetical protein